MEKFTKEEKTILESNPNIQAVLSNQVVYTKEFKEQAIKEYESGKSANQIFEEAGINTSILSNHPDYASKTLSKWRNANRKKINIHYPQKNIKNKDSANQIFEEAGINTSILSNHPDYASKTLSKWRNANRKKINIHYPQKNIKNKDSAYQKLLKRNEYLEAENEFLKKLQILNNQFRK